MRIHIPTESYGYIEADVETVEEAKMLSDEVKLEFSKDDGQGLPHLEWCRFLDGYLKEGHMTSDDYAELSKPQRYVVQEIKKALKRLGARGDE